MPGTLRRGADKLRALPFLSADGYRTGDRGFAAQVALALKAAVSA